MEISDRFSVECLTNFPITSNCFIIRKKGHGGCIITDPGSRDISAIEAILARDILRPELIILTHEHFDHIGGADLIRDKYACPLIATDMCSENITNPKKNFSMFHDHVGFACKPADIVFNKKEYSYLWSGESIDFFFTPGHSEGSLCFSIGQKLFCGDTILRDRKTVIKLPGGSREKLEQSLNLIFTCFTGETLAYPGHGDRFHLKDIPKISIL